MRALLDINVLLALFDEDHVFHERAHTWFDQNLAAGWASCPLTENGLVRIRANPNYHPSKKRGVLEMIEGLRTFIHSTDHEFWSDDVSLLDPSQIDSSLFIGPRQITDLYLLALATRNGGSLLTFDRGVNLKAVSQAKPENLQVI
jgi:toxin-antitoxin system PIN domain toxin